MTTVANVRRGDGSRFYTLTGEAVYEIPKKRGDGMKKPDIRDMIENGWVPSVTTVIKAVNKPALTRWLIEQAVLAVVTTPRKPGEPDDQFVHRVLHVECVQDEQADKAAQLGTDIHDAIAKAVAGEPYDPKFQPYVTNTLNNLQLLGKKVWSERVLVGDDYAGRSDYLGEDKEWQTLVDFKTTTKPPEKDAYAEHKMQTAAYARTLKTKKGIRTCILYLDTTNPGKIIPHIEHNWQRDFKAFNHLLQVWRYMNGVI